MISKTPYRFQAIDIAQYRSKSPRESGTNTGTKGAVRRKRYTPTQIPHPNFHTHPTTSHMGMHYLIWRTVLYIIMTLSNVYIYIEAVQRAVQIAVQEWYA